MKYIPVLLFSALLSFNWALAQTKQYTQSTDSDPEAKKILDQMKARYDSYKTVEVFFELDIELPEEPKVVQKGKILREGEKYFMDTEDYAAISDGETLWFVFKKNKEVQINEVPDESEDTGLLSPQAMFNFYEKGNYVYVLLNELMEDGKPVQQIEFKPLDTFSDYSKLRLSVHRNTKDPAKVIAFGKDGSRYTLRLKTITPNKQIEAASFTFVQSKYPGFHVEDLR